jgi:hypothetical protein
LPLCGVSKISGGSPQLGLSEGEVISESPKDISHMPGLDSDDLTEITH